MEGLSVEQRQKLEMFREVTADQRDVQGMIQLLTSCNWNMEQALQLYWAASEEAAPAPSSSAAASSSLGAPLLRRGDPNAGAPAAAPPGAVAQDLRDVPRGFLHRFARRALMVVTGVGGSVMRLLGAFLFGPMGQLGNGGNNFGRDLANQFPGPLPRFVEGPFHQALQQARNELKLLVVYLHSEHGRYTSQFCNNVLHSEWVINILDENFVCWGGDIARMEAHRVSQMIHARQYPCFCVLLPANQDEIRVIGMRNGEVEVDAIVALLTRCLEEMEQYRSEIAARSVQHVEDRALREQQDIEYQEALAKDREREEARLREEREATDRQRAAEEQRLQEQMEVRRLEEEKNNLEGRRQQRAAVLQAPDATATCRISMRLPAGQRLMRNFKPTDTLTVVYEWADCAAYLQENAGKNLEIPARFSLSTSYPNKKLEEMDRTCTELQLSGQMLLLTAIEDD